MNDDDDDDNGDNYASEALSHESWLPQNDLDDYNADDDSGYMPWVASLWLWIMIHDDHDADADFILPKVNCCNMHTF